MNKHILASLIAIAPLSAFAQDDKSISADIELGVISTSGNTKSNSLKSKIDVQQDLTNFKNHFIAEGLYKEDQVETEVDDETVIEDQVTAEKYFLSAQSDFKLNKEHRGLFVFGSYEEDKFSGYEYRGTIAIGFSDRLFNYDNSYLDYSVGPGIAFSEPEDTYDEDDVLIPGESTQNTVVRIAMDFNYKISENAKFRQTLSSDVAVESGENSKTKAVTSITANITKGLALKASFIIDQNTHVVDDKKHADTQTALTLVYSI